MDKSYIRDNLDGLIVFLQLTEGDLSVSPVFDDRDVEINVELASSLDYLASLVEEQQHHPKDSIDFISKLATPHVKKYAEEVDDLFESNNILKYFVSIAIYFDIHEMIVQPSFMVLNETPEDAFIPPVFDSFKSLTDEMFLDVLDDIDSSLGVLHERKAPTIEFNIERVAKEEVA